MGVSAFSARDHLKALSVTGMVERRTNPVGGFMYRVPDRSRQTTGSPTSAAATLSGINLPALPEPISYISALGRFMVPAAAPIRCEHPPNEQTTRHLSLAGNLRPGHVQYRDRGCWRGGEVGMWVWTGHRWRPYGAPEHARGWQGQLADQVERLMRGRTPAEAESGRAALEQRASRRAR